MEASAVPTTRSPNKEEPSSLGEAREIIRALQTQLLLLERTRDEELRRVEISNRRMTSVLQSISSAVLVTNERFEIELANNFAEDLFGIPIAEILQRKLSEILPLPELENPDEDTLVMVHALEREVVINNPRLLRKMPVLISLNLYFYNYEQSAGIVCSVTDLTKRKALEQNLLHAQKLESIGTLAAGIAHEINTPIQYIRDNTVFVRDELPRLIALAQAVQRCDGISCTVGTLQEDLQLLDFTFLEEQLPLALDQTLEGVNSVSKIVRSLKEFSHPGTQQREPIHVHVALENTFTISRNEWKYVADLETDYDTSLPSLLCYPGELNQAFLNVIVNAAHAIEEKIKQGHYARGRIRAMTRRCGESVVITLNDNGIGIPATILNKIYDPFFTTKEPGRGTGQGLALVHRFICERHQGEIHVESKEGEGTSFHITLPLTSIRIGGDQ